MGLRGKWLVLWSLWAARLVRQPTVPVRVSSGLLRGSVSPDGAHVQYLAIPYASTNYEGRFQAPGPEPVWEGIFEAVNENIRCSQRMHTFTMGQEDCLILNMYTPLNTGPEDTLPVMMFIHGGGYYQGSGTFHVYGPNYLVSKRVILVTLNYRFNIQGFLCLGIKEAPGNAGMKDIVAALRWIQKNIRAFGGDPDNVTIFGESAGAASVSFLLLSPMAKGLFHKAIVQSGSSLSSWAYQFNPVYLASLLAKVMLFESQNPHELYKYFMTKSDAELIHTRVPRKEGNVVISELLYTPCSEPIFEGVEPFLTKTPYEMLVKGEYNKVPLIIGSNTEEGALLMNMDNDTMLSKVRFVKALPKNLDFPSQEERCEVAGILERFYLGNDHITNTTKLKLSKLYGEPTFNYPVLEETEIIARTNDAPVFSYLFNYSGWRNIPKFLLGNELSRAPGAVHADELFYLFSQTIIPDMYETVMIEKMTMMWTNFAKFGNPTPDGSDLLPFKWLPVNSSSPTTLVIDSEFSTSPLWYSDSVKYLREIYSKYRKL